MRRGRTRATRIISLSLCVMRTPSSASFEIYDVCSESFCCAYTDFQPTMRAYVPQMTLSRASCACIISARIYIYTPYIGGLLHLPHCAECICVSLARDIILYRESAWDGACVLAHVLSTRAICRRECEDASCAVNWFSVSNDVSGITYTESCTSNQCGRAQRCTIS